MEQVGDEDGLLVGAGVGDIDGLFDGCLVGLLVGLAGVLDGLLVGAGVVGLAVIGDEVGEFVYPILCT